MTSIVLDAGALIALERRDQRLLALADELVHARAAAHVPAGVLAQVWRASPRQYALARLVKASLLRVDALTEAVAYRIGRLLAATGTHDVIDGHVVLLARQLNATVLTSDIDDLAALDPSLILVRV